MAPKIPILIVAGLSAVMGIAVLVMSSVIIDHFRPLDESCNTMPIRLDACTIFDLYIVAGSIAIVASLIQIGSFSLVFFGNEKSWCGLHVVISILLCVSFTITAHNEGFENWSLAKMIAFVVLCFIDMWFAAPAALGAYFFVRRNDGNYSTLE